ncbi:ATPaseAAA-typecore [Penicillium lividum]|nr:ATPaseAAA-typecore [Penicillium lividum]
MDSNDTMDVKCEFKVYRHIKKKDGEIAVKVITNAFESLAFGDEDTPYALVINRYLSEKNQLEKISLQINSKHILRVFREVIGSYPTVPFDFSSSFILESPFQMIFHHWGDLDERRQSTEGVEERMHLNLLFDFMEHEIGHDRSVMQAMVRNKQIKYLSLWCIFRPGDLVYQEFLEHPWLLKCERTAYEESKVKGPYFEVHCVYTDHDGTLAGETKTVINIFKKRSFASENPANITDLPVYPRTFVEEKDELEVRVRERGRRFLALSGVSIQQYDGQAHFLKEPSFDYWDPDMAGFEGVWLPHAELGRVVVDRKTFQEDQYSNGTRVNSTEPDPLMCPPYEFGYSLSRKEWGRYLVDRMRPAEWKEDVWRSLIIGDRQKLVLQSLVIHTISRGRTRPVSPKRTRVGYFVAWNARIWKDIDRRDGRRGDPESSDNDLPWGTQQMEQISPYDFEYRLKMLLQYATQWEAVVLMDEADVFLEARDNSGDNAARNALVAVFLKALEYFSGIVFLTTNRITSFDRAMKSRIHLALEYTPPRIETRQQLWMQILKSIPAHEIDLDPEDAVNTFVSEKMNGREIANAIHTARTIARFQKKPLEIAHIDTVLDVWHEFENSLKKASSKGPGEKDLMMIGRTNSIVHEENADFRS